MTIPLGNALPVIEVEAVIAEDEHFPVHEQQTTTSQQTPDQQVTPVIGRCAQCDKEITESMARIEENDSLFHPDHYQAQTKTKTKQ